MGAKWVHRLSEVDYEARTAVCSECGPGKIKRTGVRQDGRQKWRCSASQKSLSYFFDTDDRIRRRAEHFDRLLALQGPQCAICNVVPQDPRRLVVDHDHATGAVRGLLCQLCNTGIGHLRDDVTIMRSAIKYLESGSRPSV